MSTRTELYTVHLLQEAQNCRAMGLVNMVIMVPRKKYMGGPTLIALLPGVTGVVVGGKGDEYFVSVSTQDVMKHARSLVETAGARAQNAAEKIKL